MSHQKTKIFGIGLQRTGTTSLYHALNQLGFKSAPHSIPLFYNINDPIITEYDAFMDNPIPHLFPNLDVTFPGSKFILTTRNINRWLNSVEWLFEKELPRLPKPLRKVANEIHEAFYGCSTFHRDVFYEKWTSYHEQVFYHFEKKPEDLLVINFHEDHKWSKLCRFLDVPMPTSKDFPHFNKREKND